MGDDFSLDLSEFDARVDISGIDGAEGEIFELEGLSEEEVAGAEAVLAFHYHVGQLPDGSVEEVEKAFEKVQEYREKGVIEAGDDFLYDEGYLERLERKLEDRNMNKKISGFERDDPTEKEDFRRIERELVDYLLGREYGGEGGDDSGFVFDN